MLNVASVSIVARNRDSPSRNKAQSIKKKLGKTFRSFFIADKKSNSEMCIFHVNLYRIDRIVALICSMHRSQRVMLLLLGLHV